MAQKIKSILDNFRTTYRNLSLFPNREIQFAPLDKFIVWESQVQPTPWSCRYKLCLNYEIFYAPRIWVVEPDFADKKDLPHVYAGSSNRLCLYHPRDWEWKSSCDILKTVVLWSMMWLVYYEDYTKTGYWRGPEADHIDIDTNDVSDSVLRHHADPSYLKKYPVRIRSKKKK